METKLYLSVDGGGTKLHTLLFDSELRPVGSGVSGAINPNFVPMDLVEQHMLDSIDQALGSAKGQTGVEIEDVWISMPGPTDLYEDLLRQRCHVGAFNRLSEGETAIYSAGLSTGMLVLCGTGATLFYVKDGRAALYQGGWGSPFGDEGSGADIGCMAIKAALRSYDGWGPKTMLEPGLCDFFVCRTIRETMAAFWEKKDTRGTIASVCRLVGECAKRGDHTARSILTEAGRKAAEQAMAFMHRECLPIEGPVVLAGGAWKSGEVMLSSFVNTMAMRYPMAEIIPSAFDPVIGPVAKIAMGEGEGRLSEKAFARLRSLYPEYQAKWPVLPKAPCSPMPEGVGKLYEIVRER